MQGLSKLDDDHRTVLVLRDIEGMAYAEIAETLELELGTVKSRLSRRGPVYGTFLSRCCDAEHGKA